MKNTSIFIILFILNTSLFGQNLIVNGDFESHDDCPKYLGQYFMAEGWNTANLGTPDYFNDCSLSYDFGTSYNKKGGQPAHSGKAYMGIQVDDLHSNHFYEYLETKLPEPLQAGQTYCFSMFVSLGNTDCAVKDFGVAFSTDVVRINNSMRLDLPYIPLKAKSSLSDSLSWVCVKGIYAAKGGENFLIIGNFDKGNPFNRMRINPDLGETFYYAYYFIDDVALVPLKEGEVCECKE